MRGSFHSSIDPPSVGRFSKPDQSTAFSIELIRMGLHCFRRLRRLMTKLGRQIVSRVECAGLDRKTFTLQYIPKTDFRSLKRILLHTDLCLRTFQSFLLSLSVGVTIAFCCIERNFTNLVGIWKSHQKKCLSS